MERMGRGERWQSKLLAQRVDGKGEATKTETAMGRIREEVGWQRNGEQEQKMDGHGDSW